MIEKEKIIQYLKEEIKTFKLDNFMLEQTNRKDNGAIIVITPNQLILGRTLKEGKEYHNVTFNIVDKILKEQELTLEDFDINAEINKQINSKDNICIRIFNEQIDPLLGTIKSIWIHLPNKVTEKQLLFLKDLETQYGSVLKIISHNLTKNHEDALVGYKDINNNVILDDSFSKVITYIEKYLLDNNNNYEQDKIIIGKTNQDNQKHL